MLSETTSIHISKKTAEDLNQLREKLGVESLDEVIQFLIRKHRSAILERSFGVDRGKIKPFSEEDRGENRG